MNEYVSPSKKKSFFAVIIYFFMQYIFQGLLVDVYRLTKFDTSNLSENEFISQIYSVFPDIMFITLFATLALLLALYGRDLIKQFKMNFKNPKTYVYPLILFVVYIVFAIALGLLQAKLSPNLAETENNQALNDIFTYGKKSIYLINVIVMAPIVEEIVFRYSLVNLFSIKAKSLKWLPYLISAFVFALIHESTLLFYGFGTIISLFTTYVPSDIVVVDEFLQFCAYFVPAIPLTFGYMFTKRNIVSAIILHMFINILASFAMILA